MPISTTLIDTVEIVTVGTTATGGSNSRTLNFCFHYKRGNTAMALSRTNVDTAFQAQMMVPILAMLNARYSQATNNIRWLNDAVDPYTPFAHVNAGGVAGDSMPTDQAAYFLQRTGLRGRKYRGSKHFAPMSEADTTAGTDDIFNAAALARMATVAAALLAGFTDANMNVWVPAVVSRRPPSQLVVNPTTVVANVVTTVLVKKSVGTMNHRKVKSVY